MFKAVLIIFVVGFGDTDSASTNVTPFETMEQCEAAIVHVKDVWDDWHYGKDKSNTVPIKYSAKCFDIPPGPVAAPSPLTGVLGSPPEALGYSEPEQPRQWDWKPN